MASCQQTSNIGIPPGRLKGPHHYPKLLYYRASNCFGSFYVGVNQMGDELVGSMFVRAMLRTIADAHPYLLDLTEVSVNGHTDVLLKIIIIIALIWAMSHAWDPQY